MQSCAEASERALEHVRRADDRFEEREIIEWLVIALLLGPAPAPDAIRRFEGLLGEVGDDPFLQAEILGALAPLVAMQGRQAEADDIVARGGMIMDESGAWVWIVFFWRAFIHLWRGDASAAEQELRPAYEMLKRIGEQSHFSSLAHALATVLYAQGLYADAEQMTQECEAAAAQTTCTPRSSGARSGRRRSRAETRSTTALLLAHEAVVLAQESDFLPAHADALADLAEVLRLAGREDEARAALEEAIVLYEQKGNLLASAAARASLDSQAENKRTST